MFLPLYDGELGVAPGHAPMIGRLSRFDLPSLRSGHRVRYEVRANWKLVFQNYSLLPWLTADPDYVRSFVREARVQGRLEHPAIVPVHDLEVK